MSNISTSGRTSSVRCQTNLFIPCGDQNQDCERGDNKLILKADCHSNEGKIKQSMLLFMDENKLQEVRSGGM